MELIYFLYAERSSMVKIGWTKNIVQRVIRIRKTCPHDLRLLAVRPGNRDMEAAYHRHFSVNRHHGEWFFFDTHVRDWLAIAMRIQYPEAWAYVEQSFNEQAPGLRCIRETSYTAVSDVLDPGTYDMADSLEYTAYAKERQSGSNDS